MRRPRAWAFDCGVSTVDQVGNTALREPCAKQGAITVAKRMVEDGTGQTIVFSEDYGVMQRVCRRQRGTSSFELLSDVHDDKGLVLNDEDRSPVERRALHQIFQWRGKACQRQGGLVTWTAGVPRCRSILTPQQNEMIDLGGKARVAETGSVLRGVC
jgi:hypothetical protein